MHRLNKPFILWLTGLPCSGKSTLAKAIEKKLVLGEDFPIKVLDGDEFRKEFSGDLGFSIEDRHTNNLRAAEKAIEVSKTGMAVIVAIVSAYRKTREEIKKLSEQVIEVYVECSLETCESRDVKGMYKKARKNQITFFTGVNDPYEEPLNPDIKIETDIKSLEECVNIIINKLMEIGYISTRSN